MLRLVLISLAIASASAIVCAPDICSRVLCAEGTAENCNGKIVHNGSFCGCCDACVNTLAEGSSCMQGLLIGAPVSATCDDGLVCDPVTMTCQDPANIVCVRDVIMQAGGRLLACTQYGSHALHQCDGSVCYCVDRYGNRIPGFSDNINQSDKMDCLCARDQNIITQAGLIGRLLACTQSGSYAPHQCDGFVCYCVDRYGNRIPGFSDDISQSANMDCKCAREQYAYMQTGLIGRLFMCTKSGSYVQHKCKGFMCYCVDPYGNRIPDYSVSIGQTANMDCKCAHDQYAYMQTGLIGRLFTCTQSGSYAPHHCEGSVCYCVDPYGTRIPDYSVNIGQSANMDCQCARDQYAYMQVGLYGRLFTCNKAGSYQRYACTGSVCYCVDNLGNKLAGSPTVNIGYIGALHC